MFTWRDDNTLRNFYNCNKYLDKILSEEFWFEYFSLRDIPITNQQDNILAWIHEFRTNEIIKSAARFKSVTCSNNITAHIRNHPGIRCSNSSIPNGKFCYKCVESLLVNNNIHNHVKIKFNTPIKSYLTHDASVRLLTIRRDHKHIFPLNSNVALINIDDKNNYVITERPFMMLEYRYIKRERLYQMLFELFSKNNIINYQVI